MTTTNDPYVPLADAREERRFGGKAGIDSFTELRWITVETEAGHFPI